MANKSFSILSSLVLLATIILLVLAVVLPVQSGFIENGPEEAEDTVPKCLALKDINSCHNSSEPSGLKCVWCSCKAVPSVCCNSDQAKRLPKGVFNCDNGTLANSMDTEIEPAAALESFISPHTDELESALNEAINHRAEKPEVAEE